MRVLTCPFCGKNDIEWGLDVCGACHAKVEYWSTMLRKSNFYLFATCISAIVPFLLGWFFDKDMEKNAALQAIFWISCLPAIIFLFRMFYTHFRMKVNDEQKIWRVFRCVENPITFVRDGKYRPPREIKEI